MRNKPTRSTFYGPFVPQIYRHENIEHLSELELRTTCRTIAVDQQNGEVADG